MWEESEVPEVEEVEDVSNEMSLRELITFI